MLNTAIIMSRDVNNKIRSGTGQTVHCPVWKEKKLIFHWENEKTYI